MKKVIFLFLITLSFKSSYACGPYASGTMMTAVFSPYEKINSDQLFLFSMHHYSDRFKSYGKNFNVYLQDTASKVKILLKEDDSMLRGTEKHTYLGLRSPEKLNSSSVYQFVLEVDGQLIKWFSNEIYCGITYQYFEVNEEKQNDTHLVSIQKLNKYNDNVTSAKIKGVQNRIYKITLNTQNKESIAYFVGHNRQDFNLGLSNLSADTNISITLLGVDGQPKVTQYFKVDTIKKWTPKQNS